MDPATFWGAIAVGVVTTIILATPKAVKERLLPFLRKRAERLTAKSEPADEGYGKVDLKAYVDRKEFEDVAAAFRDADKSVIVIWGIGGIGKSTLAGYFLTHLAEQQGYQVIHSPFVCKGGLTLESVIATLASHPTFGSHFQLIAQDTRTAREKIGGLVTALEETGRYGLFFDDYHEANSPDLDEFIRRVAQHGKKTQLLLTSRVKLELFNSAGVATVHLTEGLPLDAAKGLLYRRNPHLQNESDAIIEQIWQKCHRGHPYALVTFAELSTREPVAKLLTTLPDFNERDEDWQRRLFAQLTRAEQRLALAFSLLRKPLPREALEHLHSLYPHRDWKEARDGLLQRGIVYPQQDGAFVMHDLFREFCSKQLQRGRFAQRRQRTLHHHAAEFYVSLPAASEQEDVEWKLEAHEHWLSSGSIENAAACLEQVQPALDKLAQYQRLLGLLERMHEHGNCLSPNLLIRFAHLLQIAGRLEDAVGALQTLLDHQDVRVRARAKERLAFFHIDRDEYAQGLPLCEESLKDFRSAGDEAGLALVLEMIGFAHVCHDQAEPAIALLRQALEIQERIGDLLAVSRCLRHLATAYTLRGDIAEAHKLLMRAMDIAQRNRNLSEEGSIRLLIGDLHQALAEYEEAQKCYEEGLRIREEAGETAFAATYRLKLGQVHRKLGDPERALEYLKDAEGVTRRFNQRDRVARTLLEMGLIYESRGNLADACRYYKEALVLDMPSSNYKCAVKLGTLCLEEGKAKEAQDYFTRGIALCRALLEKTPRLYNALYYLALAQLGSGQPGEAFATYRQALEVCSAKGVVQDALQNLRLLQRAAQPVAGLAEVVTLLEGAMCER